MLYLYRKPHGFECNLEEEKMHGNGPVIARGEAVCAN